MVLEKYRDRGNLNPLFRYFFVDLYVYSAAFSAATSWFSASFVTPGTKLSICLSGMASIIAAIISSLITPESSCICSSVLSPSIPSISLIACSNMAFPFGSAMISPIVELRVYTFGRTVSDSTCTSSDRSTSCAFRQIWIS